VGLGVAVMWLMLVPPMCLDRVLLIMRPGLLSVFLHYWCLFGLGSCGVWGFGPLT